MLTVHLVLLARRACTLASLLLLLGESIRLITLLVLGRHYGSCITYNAFANRRVHQ